MTLAEEENGPPGENADYETAFRVSWWIKFGYMHPDAREIAIKAEWRRYCAGLPAGDEEG